MSRCRVRAGAPATVRRDEPAEIPPAGAVDRPRGHPGGRAGPHLRGPRHRRAAGGVGKLLPLPPSKSAAAVGRGEPALLQLVRPARPDGPQRVPDLRPPHGRAAPLDPFFPCARLEPPQPCSAPSPWPPAPPAAAAARSTTRRSPARPRTSRSRPRRSSGATRAATRRRPDARRPRPSPAAPPPRATSRLHRHRAEHRQRHRTDGTGTAGTDSGGATAPGRGGLGRQRHAPPAGSDAQQFEDFCAQNPAPADAASSGRNLDG